MRVICLVRVPNQEIQVSPSLRITATTGGKRAARVRFDKFCSHFYQ